MRPKGSHPVDLVVVGEGEQTLVEALTLLSEDGNRREALQGVNGLAFLEGEGAVVAHPRVPTARNWMRLLSGLLRTGADGLGLGL